MPKWLTKRYAPLESSSSKLCPGLAHKGHALWTGTSRVEWHLSPLKFSQAVCTVDYSCWNGSFLFYMFVSGGSQKACAVGSTFLHKRYASLETSVSKMGVKHCQNVLRLRSNSSVSETSLSETCNVRESETSMSETSMTPCPKTLAARQNDSPCTLRAPSHSSTPPSPRRQCPRLCRRTSICPSVSRVFLTSHEKSKCL